MQTSATILLTFSPVYFASFFTPYVRVNPLSTVIRFASQLNTLSRNGLQRPLGRKRVKTDQHGTIVVYHCLPRFSH